MFVVLLLEFLLMLIVPDRSRRSEVWEINRGSFEYLLRSDPQVRFLFVVERILNIGLRLSATFLGSLGSGLTSLVWPLAATAANRARCRAAALAGKQLAHCYSSETFESLTLIATLGSHLNIGS
jgi:hypothetical protein